MPADYYSDSVEAPQTAETPPREQENEQTTTIPKSMCPGMKIGDVVPLRIVGEMENEYQVSYGKGSPAEETESPESEDMMESPAPGGMASMMG